MKTNQAITIGDSLKIRRKKLGLTQTEVANKLNCSMMQISYIERGGRFLKIEFLERWADILGLEVEINLKERF